MRVGLGQFNALVGDLEGNTAKMCDFYGRALSADVDLLIFPELAVCGYPPEDLLHKKHFLEDNCKAIEALGADCPEKTIIAGFAEGFESECYNSAAVLRNGKIEQIYRKALLPNYGVFDEKRYFSEGDKPLVIGVGDFNVALTICRDIWQLDWLTDFLGSSGQIDLIVNISASPFHLRKIETRKHIVGQCAKQFNCAVCYCNLVGGQDEIVFDGRSMLAGPDGQIVSMGKAFTQDLLIADLEKVAGKGVSVIAVGEPAEQPADLIEEAYKALVLGTSDYTNKNGFKNTLIGLSGGIDSALVAVIAVDALGSENVTGITMPSKFNTAETISDAEKLAKNLGIEFLTIPIESVLNHFNESLRSVEGWNDQGVAFENLQARIRGTMLMSLSNQFGALVLTTGNKSETAVGYSTLYGDTAGGFAVIKDVPKTLVYKLCEYVNNSKGREVIPVDIITRPPSAELRADQKDSDSLPDYDLLDEILEGYVEKDKSAEELIRSGLPADIVRHIIRLVDRNEYKRRQSPPGIKITPKAFGRDRRLPITNRYGSPRK